MKARKIIKNNILIECILVNLNKMRNMVDETALLNYAIEKRSLLCLYEAALRNLFGIQVELSKSTGKKSKNSVIMTACTAIAKS